jgi:hypothetical protein
MRLYTLTPIAGGRLDVILLHDAAPLPPPLDALRHYLCVQTWTTRLHTGIALRCQSSAGTRVLEVRVPAPGLLFGQRVYYVELAGGLDPADVRALTQAAREAADGKEPTRGEPTQEAVPAVWRGEWGLPPGTAGNAYRAMGYHDPTAATYRQWLFFPDDAALLGDRGVFCDPADLEWLP